MTFEKSPKMRARMGKQLQIAHQMVKGPNPFGAPGFIACVHTTGRAPDRSVIMSQYVQRATGVAKQAAEVFSKRVVPPAVEYYNATMAKNAQYVVKDPAAVDKLGKQLVYSNLAKLPVMVEGAQAEMNIVKQKWAGRMDLPMTEVRSPGAMSSVIPRTVFACPARVFLARGVGSIEGRPKSHPRLTYPLSAHRRLAPPLSSPRRCTRGSASGKSSAEAGA